MPRAQGESERAPLYPKVSRSLSPVLGFEGRCRGRRPPVSGRNGALTLRGTPPSEGLPVTHTMQLKSTALPKALLSSLASFPVAPEKVVHPALTAPPPRAPREARPTGAWLFRSLVLAERVGG